MANELKELKSNYNNMKHIILMIITAILLVGCNLNSNDELENSSKNLVKVQVLKLNIESAKIEIENLENINKLLLKDINIGECISARKYLEHDLKELKTLCDSLNWHETCASYETYINDKRIYELTDRIKEYNDQLNSIKILFES